MSDEPRPIDDPTTIAATVRRHLILGWLLLAVFVVMGLLLEVFHGLKLGLYVDLSNATRRLMWTLCHAHGALMGLINFSFAWSLVYTARHPDRGAVASACLVGASILLPGGFFLGGVVVYGGDPGLGILLTPVGAALLLVTIGLTIRRLRASAAMPFSSPTPSTGSGSPVRPDATASPGTGRP